MPYTIKYEPLNRLPGAKPGTVTKGTAGEAWAEVQALQASDEKVVILNDAGVEIGWRELKAIAEKEAH
jgi:hypothetical protein